MGHRLLREFVAVGALFAGALGCSSSSGPSAPVDAGKDARDARVVVVAKEGGILDATEWDASIPDAFLSITDAGPDVAVVNDPANCVPPGTASNGVGVGGYCSPGGEQCNHASADAGPTLCTADFGAPAHLWFCTLACSESSQCGVGALACRPAAGGSACVPSACAAFVGDAATDSGLVSADAARDSSVHAGDAGDAGHPHDASDGG